MKSSVSFLIYVSRTVIVSAQDNPLKLLTSPYYQGWTKNVDNPESLRKVMVAEGRQEKDLEDLFESLENP